MRRTLAVLLSLAMAFGALFCCAGTALAAERRYELPKSIQGQDELVGEKSKWNMEVSYNKATRTLLCESVGKDRYDPFYNYLYTLSTDSSGNRFVDRYNSTSTLAGTGYKDLISVDPIRSGKIRYIVLSRKDKEGTYLTGVYSFETRDNRVVRSTVASPQNYYSQLSQIETRYEYDREGKIVKISKSNLSLQVPCRVEASFTYDNRKRPSGCTINTVDFEKGVTLASYKQTYRKYNSYGWPTRIAETDLSDNDVSLSRVDVDFNSQSQLTRDGRVYYYYDTEDRLTRTEKSFRYGSAGDGIRVEYSGFFKI